MAGSAGVWGIEVGQSALKALHCVRKGDEIVADAFDFIEYPKILSQPDANPEEMIGEALAQFVERNEAIRDRVCISVPGQSGLAKFFKPPPVDLKKIADIVRYEAKQQIPFELSDVIWDYQMMPGAVLQEGYALESEVGLFAMKRDQAYRQMAPFEEADIEIDSIQLAPISLYNAVAFDRMNERLETEDFDVDNPPTSTVILSIGTDSSDLVITNGFRIWQRSMPIGGNHFTRQLTKDLKLTFAKAEHLKRNAREAVDPKLVFQTMRPVFNDLVTEVQRSIGFFRSMDKKAEITELLVTGNTVKMPGLAAYLGKNLGYEVQVLDRFNRLTGEDVMSMPTFRDNVPTFAVCYGLCLQALDMAQVHTTLVPHEILTQRMIRAKKPWALLGITALLLGTSIQYALTQRSWATTQPKVWQEATTAVSNMSSYSGDEKAKDATLESRLAFLNSLGEEVSGNAEDRLIWLEMFKAVNSLIPLEKFPEGKIPSPATVPLEDRIDFHFTELDTKKLPDLAAWYSPVIDQRYKEEMRNWARTMDRKLSDEFATDTGPTGEGWVIQLTGYHYFNSVKKKGFEGTNHVRKYLTTNFLEKPIILPGPDGQPMSFTPKEMGFDYPLQLDEKEPVDVIIPNPDYDPASPSAMLTPPKGLTGPKEITGPNGEKFMYQPPTLRARRLDFMFQFIWKPMPLSERVKLKLEAEAEAADQVTADSVDVAMN